MPDTKHVQYVLVDKDGEVQMRTHQDDTEDPIVGATIVGLLNEASKWADLSVNDFIEIELTEKYAVLCEEVTRRPLNLSERTALNLLIMAAEDED